jgi:murein DD-endopeptidase MepM/ murein hydrolase activator NlpD
VTVWTPCRRFVVVVAVIVFGVGVPGAPTVAGEPPIIVFPVDGRNSYRDTFGAPRDEGSRSHQGTDIIAARLVPVVAILDGVVTVVGEGRKAGFWLEVRHDGGWRSRYLHLNNDSPGTDDGRGRGIATGIVVGAAVTAGQVIGFVGDSGNAEDTTAHLHFEIRRPSGDATNPYPILRRAVLGVEALTPSRALSLRERNDTPQPTAEDSLAARWEASIAAAAATAEGKQGTRWDDTPTA